MEDEIRTIREKVWLQKLKEYDLIFWGRTSWTNLKVPLSLQTIFAIKTIIRNQLIKD